MEKRFSVIARYENVKIRLQFNDFNDAVGFYEQSSKRPNLIEVYMVSNYTGEILRSYDVEQNTSGITTTEYKSMLYCELCGLYNI